MCRAARATAARIDGAVHLVVAPQSLVGDRTCNGGTIVTAAQVTLADGVPAARMGDLHSCPIPFHGVTRIVTGSNKTLIEGQPAARQGDVAGCGAVIVTGSSKTMVE